MVFERVDRVALRLHDASVPLMHACCWAQHSSGAQQQ
jgi:hypothetical protein